MCFGRAFHLILIYFYILYSMFWGKFSKIWLFFLKSCFSRISIHPIWCSINRNLVKKIQWASAWFNWSNLFFDQSKIVNPVFLKTVFLTDSTYFFKTFSTFSLSLQLGKAAQRFFVIFFLNFCKVFIPQGW